ncbi:ABC transporter substrate-binding protein [Desulfovibrio inopinatus]|uniref:ABC transporter substrate-binding protein n=1 Tax=Desulfovibrio inopinatus TaxID=102109 RepID=UPI0004189A97|nr:ABC transporter substrate-binding protein [Desulfovibrio inopinatus]
MRGLKYWMVTSVMIVTLFIAFVFAVAAQEIHQELDTAWMDENETFIPWYATQHGWDKAEGIELNMLMFDTGMAQMETLPAKEWVLGGTGGVPMMFGALRHNAYLIAIGNDESMTNAVLVRPDSPILNVKGANPAYPDVYGSADTVRGKTILVTTISSGHYAMSLWLKALGLTDKDVVIKNMDPAQCVAAFERGIGDAVVLWAPQMYNGLKKGWKVASDVKKAGGFILIVLAGDKEFCDNNPEVVAKFLKVYFRGIDLVRKDGVKLAPDYVEFLRWAGLNMSDEAAKMDLEMHPVYTLDEQLKLFDASQGESQVQAWQKQLVQFFTSLGKLKQEEGSQLETGYYITDKFLKLVPTVK